ncbi:hypothetical protein QJ854_gp564 [Moumouvirus goulette]|uniref:Uncharacterized protein n=1 Tax=Moumouvirus goulette TaxID=1247379 RepID=M1PGS4_9VIRU|nr:hypothetical protein QJ854_gp564 [Moumouvirus goulette]AGF85218.1 hypothetical protein glt_00409 [Moumouvirus goulette]
MNSPWGSTYECYHKQAENNSHTVHVHHHHHHHYSTTTRSFSETAARVNPSGSPYYNPGVPTIRPQNILIVTPGFTKVDFIPVVQRSIPW